MRNVFVIRDDWDQATVCVVDADSEQSALAIAAKQFGSDRGATEGEFYAIEVPLIQEDK